MKVLYITNNYPTSNLPIFGIFVKEQISSINNLGVETDIFFINGREKGKKEYFLSIVRLRKHLKRNKYDIIHCHHSFSALIYMLTGRFFNRKNILSYQNPPKYEGGKIQFLLLYTIFDRIIIKSLTNENKFKKVIYLPNGVDTHFFQPYDKTESKKILNLDEKNKYIVFLDSYNLRIQKRVDRFNETIKILKEKYLLKNIESIILNNVERNLMPRYFASSEVHLLTSDFEGSPNSVKESLSCNIPVVSTPVGNVKEIIHNIKGCYISKTFDPEELAYLCYSALQIETFNGREIFLSKKLDIETVAQKLLSIYKSIITK